VVYLRLNAEYVKKLFNRGFFKSWDPEVKECGQMRDFYVKLRTDVINLIGGGKSILDVATGKGRFAIPLALAGNKVIAVDISLEMLDIANERAKKAGVANRITFQEGDAEQLPIRESFDVVCCMDAFVHLPNPYKAMNELHRLCKVGGMVIANATNCDPEWRSIYINSESRLSSIRKVIYRIIRPFYYHKLMYPLRIMAHKYLGTPLRRQNESVTEPYAKSYSKDEFVKIFENTGILVENVLEYGSPVPVFFLVIGRKVN
jgi:ubiquinone/menaquinone biosynthesis C-methylase UbiE